MPKQPKATNAQRTQAAIWELYRTRSTTPLRFSRQSIDRSITSRANDYGQALGPRTDIYVGRAIEGLRAHKYVSSTDDNEFELTPAGETKIIKMNYCLAPGYSIPPADEQQYRDICLQARLKFAAAKALTPKELERENRRLRREKAEHDAVCLGVKEQAMTAEENERQEWAAAMEVDPQLAEEENRDNSLTITTSSITPIRKSVTLNNPLAYPTPMSEFSHRISSASRSSSSPPPSPFTGLPSDSNEAESNGVMESHSPLQLSPTPFAADDDLENSFYAPHTPTRLSSKILIGIQVGSTDKCHNERCLKEKSQLREVAQKVTHALTKILNVGSVALQGIMQEL